MPAVGGATAGTAIEAGAGVAAVAVGGTAGAADRVRARAAHATLAAIGLGAGGSHRLVTRPVVHGMGAGVTGMVRVVGGAPGRVGWTTARHG